MLTWDDFIFVCVCVHSRYDSEYDNFRGRGRDFPGGNVTSECEEESDFFQEDFDIDSDVGNILDKAASSNAKGDEVHSSFTAAAAAAAASVTGQKNELTEVAEEIEKNFGAAVDDIEKEKESPTGESKDTSGTNRPVCVEEASP